MTYEIGQRILVEARIRNPEIDGDGDIQIHFGEAHTDWVYVSAAKTREIPVEPTKIAFDDIKVGDKIRASDVGVHEGYTSHYVFDGVTVEKVLPGEVFGSGGVTFRNYMSYTYELISRPEREPIKVDDKIPLEQVKTLPIGSVVDCGAPRTVSLNGLFNAMSDTTYGWNNYGGLLRDFTVKYIA